MNETQSCKCCHELKPLTQEFYRREPRVASGFTVLCCQCLAEKSKKRRLARHDYYLEKEAVWRNTPESKQYHSQYYQQHQTVIKARANQAYQINPEPFLLRSKEQKVRLGDKYKRYLKEYRRKNRKRLSIALLERLHTDVPFRLKHYLRNSLRKCVKGYVKQSKTLEYLGCPIDQFREHLTAQFTSGMTWKNYGEWHLDHIIPCANFDFNCEADIHRCFHYTNFQPLWAADNIAKGDKLPNGELARNHEPNTMGFFTTKR